MDDQTLVHGQRRLRRSFAGVDGELVRRACEARRGMMSGPSAHNSSMPACHWPWPGNIFSLRIRSTRADSGSDVQ